MLKTCSLLLSFFLSATVFSQSISDGFRYLQPVNGGGVNGRATGFSNTTFGSDASALFSNPASMGFIKKNQVSLGYELGTINTESNFNSNTEKKDYSISGFDNLSIVLPAPVSRGSFVIGFGYNKLVSFDQLSTGGAFNGNSSYAESISGYDPSVRPAIASNDLNDRINKSLYFEYAFEAFLVDTVRLPNGSFRYRTPAFHGNVDQSYQNVSEGDLNQWLGGFSFEAAKDIYIGASFGVIFGEYNNSYKWNENAVGNFYSNNPDSGIKIGDNKYTFNRLEFTESINDEIYGYQIKFGSLFRLNEEWRAGLSVTLPTTVNITSDYSYDLVGYYKNAQSGIINSFGHPNGKYSEKISYDVTGPSIIELNVGYIGFPFQAEIGISSMNWSNMKFVSTDDLVDFESTNETIKFKSKRTYNVKAGAEYALSDLTSIIRVGVAANERLTQSFQSKTDLTYSFGWEYVLSTEFRFNFAYTYNTISSTYSAYTPVASTGKSPVTYDEKVGNQYLVFGILFSF